MCGRFALTTPIAEIAANYFDISGVEEFTPSFNIAPGLSIATIRIGESGAAECSWARWGFRPRWADQRAPQPINARAEKAATSRYFREAFERRRCLIPASGWYEWRQENGTKQPYYITLNEEDAERVLFLAGLWEPLDESPGACCVVLTEAAAPALEPIHPRQPVVLDPSCRWEWLSPERTTRTAVRQASRRLPAARLQYWRVSTAVNRPQNDGQELIKPEGSA
ncbi:SOS response-associated peptidase [Halorhodospira halochloris]|uniref:SOS response-associated peptidase n=1 Tax=Halorhodospira halochloris TaxID=1052 RepID=UPI001EE8AA9C|nr:SOS response-associated peptidase [Halorhodospira halochloris]MCG5549538.1 SOS response-associated peptidase [Halorhodospira halochloris]